MAKGISNHDYSELESEIKKGLSFGAYKEKYPDASSRTYYDYKRRLFKDYKDIDLNIDKARSVFGELLDAIDVKSNNIDDEISRFSMLCESHELIEKIYNDELEGKLKEHELDCMMKKKQLLDSIDMVDVESEDDFDRVRLVLSIARAYNSPYKPR